MRRGTGLATGPVDVNTATVEELAALGIGPTGAAAIVAGRPYELVDQLVSKRIIAQATFDAIKNRIVVAAVAVKSGGDEKKAPAATGPVDVNTATVEELDALEGIGPTRAAEIVAGRPYTSIDDLVAKGVVPQATFERIKGNLVVGLPQRSRSASKRSRSPGPTGLVHLSTGKAGRSGRPVAGPRWRSARASSLAPHPGPLFIIASAGIGAIQGVLAFHLSGRAELKRRCRFG